MNIFTTYKPVNRLRQSTLTLTQLASCNQVGTECENYEQQKTQEKVMQ